MIRQSAVLLHRALRVDVRLIRPHVFRVSLLVCLVYWLFSAQSRFLTGAPGLEFFALIHLCNVWFITFAGVTFFATAITEEKEEQTLGLLQMAGISAPALLTGKWAPRVVGGVLLLSVQMPFTLLAITLGGVLWDQVIAAYCTLLAHLVLVGCIGLFSSVVARRSTVACVVAAVMLVLLFVMPRLVVLAIPLPTPAALSEVRRVCDEIIRASAWARLSEIQATNFNEPPVDFQVTANLAGGAAFFILAWSLFGIFNRNEAAAAATGLWSKLFRWGRRRSRRSWASALMWKDFFFSSGGLRLLLLKLIAYALLLLAFTSYLMLVWSGPNRSFARVVREFGENTMGLMLVMLVLEVAVIAARCFRNEVRQQTWSSLCMLPRSISEIAYRKFAGQGLSLLPVVAWFWFGALLAPGTVVEFLDDVFRDAEAFLVLVYLVSQIVWFVHVIAILSVAIDWAAWPVSIFCGGLVVFLWNSMFLACLSDVVRGPPSEVLLFMMCAFGCGQVAFTHWLIGERLRILAGR